MKILITGATGFIGSHLIEELSKDNEIYGLVRWDFGNNNINCNKVYGDLTDPFSINKIITEIKPDLVLNLAALTSVDISFKLPTEYAEINYKGVINLAEACKDHKIKIIHAGTPEEYGPQKSYPTKESSVLNPISPYAISKVAATNYLLYIHKAFNSPVIISRHANCYGRTVGNFSKLGVIESIVTQMIKNEKEINLGPNTRRDFLYIKDILNWYKKLIEKGEPGEIYNAGFGKSWSIKEVAEIAKKRIGWNGKINFNTFEKRPGEIKKIEIDSRKAKETLGWEPSISLKEGVWEVIKYWKKILK